MKRINIIWIILFVLTIPLIFASEFKDFGTFRLNDNVRLEQGCVDSTYSNITSIQYPNGTPILSSMTSMINFVDNLYYYNLTTTNILGVYRVSGICDEYGSKTLWGATFLITPNGYTIDTPKSIMIFVGLGMMLIMGFLFFVFGMNNQMIGVKIFSIGLAVILIVFSLGYTLMTLNYTIGEFSGLTGNINSLYFLAMALLVVGGIGLLLFLISFALNAFYKSRGMRD